MNPKTDGAAEEDDLYAFSKIRPDAAGGMRTSAGRAFIGQQQQSGMPPGTRGARTGVTSSTITEEGRPATSNRGAGFQGAKASAGRGFFPNDNATKRAHQDGPESIEIEIKQSENRISRLIEESIVLSNQGNPQAGLEKAKEAAKKERFLARKREEAGQAEQTNLDLTYSVLFNLANQYHGCKMYSEALTAYTTIVKNKSFNYGGRLRVNMGNIHFEQKKYQEAVKMYRMALDVVPNTSRDIRLKIMRNIGNCFIKMGQYQDAATSFEAIMELIPDVQAGFNLILCYFAIGDRERMRTVFQKMVTSRSTPIDQLADNSSVSPTDEQIDDQEVFREDELRALSRERNAKEERYLMLAAKLIAPAVDGGQTDAPGALSQGYDWVVEMLKNSAHPQIASELEIAKAISYLKSKEFAKAIDVLKAFEKRDKKLVGTAATNLSFLYFLDRDYKQAEKYAEIAISNDRYNAKAITNKGNCYFQNAAWDQAKEIYQEAISVDAVCVEAMYNLALVHKRTDRMQEALSWFEKLHAMLKNNPEVIFHIMDIYDKMGDLNQALEWMNVLISVVPTDPNILGRLGDMFARGGDRSQAHQYYSESFRYYSSSMPVLTWLGAYYVDAGNYEAAIPFFERAAQLESATGSTIKWQLMIASCLRRAGSYKSAYEMYKSIHEHAPEDVECLKFLIRMSNDLGIRDLLPEYNRRLDKLLAASGSEMTYGEEDSLTAMRVSTMMDKNAIGGKSGGESSGLKYKKIDAQRMKEPSIKKSKDEPDVNFDDVDDLLPE